MEKQKPLLLLFDGNALVHRAYHALPLLTTRTRGEVVNAVRGFTATLLKVISEISPRYWAIAFDPPFPTLRGIDFDTFREEFESYRKKEGYKSQRPPTPPEFISQLKRAREMAAALNIPVFEVTAEVGGETFGFEADDVLATLSKKAEMLDINTMIISPDGDIRQLVSPKVTIYAPGRAASEPPTYYDETKVRERYGLAPGQLADLKVFVGDASDNIPGVPGIGEKTATRLLAEYGDLEGIYENIELIRPEKVRNHLKEGREQAFASRKLTQSQRDVPVDFDLEKCQVSAYDREKVVHLFHELEFVDLLKKLPASYNEKGEAVKAERDSSCRYCVVISREELAKLAGRIREAGEFSLDTEATDKDAMTADLVGISVSVRDGEAYYIPVGHLNPREPQLSLEAVKETLGPALSSPAIKKVTHNGKWDYLLLSRHGIKPTGPDFDTMIAAYLVGEKALSLKALAFNKLKVEMTPISELIGSGSKQITMAQVEVEKAADYAAADADMTLKLKAMLEEGLKKEKLSPLFNEVEMPLVPVLRDMEESGVLLDTALLKDMSEKFRVELGELEEKIYSFSGEKFNVNSTQQLANVLYENLKLPRPRKTKVGYSTDASVLEEMVEAHPVIGVILRYRQLYKLKSTYMDALPALVNPKTGRLHTSFNQTGTTTGRLSSSEPNLQNLPVRDELGRQIRRAVIAPEGALLLSADYSQIDLRALAHLSQDPQLMAAFLAGEDIHAVTAARIYSVADSAVTPEMRRLAKTVNFGVIYGMSEFGLEQATDLSREESRAFISAYFEKYPRVKEYLEATKEKARKEGYVETALGRRRYIPEIHSPNRQLREGAERMAINMPVQGTSADIIKIAMIKIHRAMREKGLKSLMTLQIHDELLFEAPRDEVETLKKLVLEIMPSALTLWVPLKVDVKTAPSWGDM